MRMSAVEQLTARIVRKPVSTPSVATCVSAGESVRDDYTCQYYSTSGVSAAVSPAISVAKSAKLFKSATEKRDLQKHLLVSVAVCDQKHANRSPRLKVGVSVVV